MITSIPRRLSRLTLSRLLLRRAAPYDGWTRSALVFAPHPDDETLGCGGTIAKKRRRGAAVHIAFLTDGSRSHQGRIDPAELRQVRREEAVFACRELGVAESQTSFFEIQDGSLGDHADVAAEQAYQLLERLDPDEVFVPCRADAQPDHLATRNIALTALARRERQALVYEYPVWFWHHWPWVSLGRHRSAIRSVLRATVRGENAIYRDLCCAADVRDVLSIKRAALGRHRSQMERLRSDVPWPTLSDVAGGEWLECFFSGREWFVAYEFASRARQQRP